MLCGHYFIINHKLSIINYCSLMYTDLKETAVKLLNGNFYSQRVFEKFFSNPKNKRFRPWLVALNDFKVLNRYIDCHDAKFFGNEETIRKSRRKYLSACGITAKQMEIFTVINHVLLLDAYEHATNEELKNYYKMLVYLSGNDEHSTYIVSQRTKLQEFFYKNQVKLINSFVANSPSKEELREFIIVSILFSNGDICYDEETRNNFLLLCYETII